MRPMGFVMVLALVLVSSAAVAQVPKWCQLPGEDPSLWSQLDQCQNWTALAADDFFCDDGSPINRVEWWGIHVPPECGTPQTFIIRFYSDVPADPANPDQPWSHPGDIILEQECFSATEVWDEEYQQYHYSQELPQWFYQEVGTVYWFSVQAEVCMPDQGWGWCECDPSYYWNDEAVWTSQNPDPYWFFPTWTPPSVFTGDPDYYYMELAFCLFSELGSPVEDSSWGNIKALYR